ncbi:cyanophycinase [Simiduia sp. 21SJ11W-1]|uniref:cyanophycinase n=1 Tax=Simiduia sp. 21SJ11W-1 TaxID=2909669 RepID=UPI00209FB2B8|nr:cyanophycinase [Simiduia sp. 21SJ11W-1]UTA46475.1 cyanophycinase [Simiduia sp. 21SJ11W-1]
MNALTRGLTTLLAASSLSLATHAYQTNIVGNSADVSRSVARGTCLMGGGTDVDDAFRWLNSRSGGGDVVVLRTSGSTTSYNSYIYNLGGVDSVRTIFIESRTDANNSTVEQWIKEAEMVFITGGDQWSYYDLWDGTKIESAVNYVMNTKKAPVGGTSAGMHVLGGIDYTAQNGGVISSEALYNPYDNRVTLRRNSFWEPQYLANTVTDTHFSQRDREGRFMTFMARAIADWGISYNNVKGIAVDEATAACIDSAGKAQVFGSNYAFFAKGYNGSPEEISNNRSLDWYRNRLAVKVYVVRGNATGSRYFNVSNWSSASGGSYEYWYVDRGTFRIR